MAHCLRALGVLAEDPGVIPSTNAVANNHPLTPVPGEPDILLTSVDIVQHI